MVRVDWGEVRNLAARLIYTNLLRVLNDQKAKTEQILMAAKPFLAVQFSPKVVKAVDANRLRSLMKRLRRSSPPRDWCNTIIAHAKLAWADRSEVIPFIFEEWSCPLVRFSLSGEIPFEDWIPIPNHLTAYDIRSPADLAQLTRSDAHIMFADCPRRGNFIRLWQAATHTIATGTLPAPIMPVNEEWCANAGALAASFRCRDISNSQVAIALRSARGDLDLPADFDRAGPAAKIRLIERIGAEHSSLIRFLNTGAQLNTLRQVQDSLRSVSVGIQCWASFCDLINCPYFPPRAENVLRRSTFFKPVGTFGNYLAHLPKACQLLQIPPTWMSCAVRGVAKGLENAQDLSLKFGNYMFKPLSRSLMNHEPLRTECGRLFYLSYVFILRLPSEALPARRAAAGASLLTRHPLPRQSVLGLRSMPDGQQCLVLKLRTRKHVRSGAVLFRPCFCSGAVLASAGICPIHDFWRIVVESYAQDSPLFPSLIKRNINRILKGALRSTHVDESESYTTHCFRRGASMELKRSGPTLAQVLKTVGWNSADYRSYLSFVEDEATNIRLILMDTDGISSEEEVDNNIGGQERASPSPPFEQDSSSISETSSEGEISSHGKGCEETIHGVSKNDGFHTGVS